MNCRQFHRRVHELLDGELPAALQTRLQRHQGGCPACSDLYRELLWISRNLSTRHRLPAVSQACLWNRIQRKRARTLRSRGVELREACAIWWRDLEGLQVWARVSAAPVTLAFFALILMQFPRTDFQEWRSPAVMVPPSRLVAGAAVPVLTEVSVRSPETGISDLMDTVWKIPFEDSLSLVAEIAPDGSARIGDILEYPRSGDLLQAVDLSLRRSRFQAGESLARPPLVIYSFQKVDVYEQARGL